MKVTLAPSRHPSAGLPENKTYEGQMVISEKFKESCMNGATVGFTDDDGKGEYDIKHVPHHAPEHHLHPRRRRASPSSNTSHGCVGLADTKGANGPNNARRVVLRQLDHR
ncbi:hypothetical protein SGRIM128S_08413 [Streptomyces griseomycini]